jgi:hypothetical protein
MSVVSVHSVDRWGVTPIFDAIKHGNSACLAYVCSTKSL